MSAILFRPRCVKAFKFLGALCVAIGQYCGDFKQHESLIMQYRYLFISHPYVQRITRAGFSLLWFGHSKKIDILIACDGVMMTDIERFLHCWPFVRDSTGLCIPITNNAEILHFPCFYPEQNGLLPVMYDAMMSPSCDMSQTVWIKARIMRYICYCITITMEPP